MGFAQLATNLLSDIGKVPQAYREAWKATKALGGLLKGRSWSTGEHPIKGSITRILNWDEKAGFFSNILAKDSGSKLAFGSIIGGTVGGIGLAGWGATKAFSDSEEDSLQHIHNLLANRRS
jgi:hypothetical protein